MSAKLFLAANLAATIFLVGCTTPIPPGAERGPNGTMAYEVLVEASSPGARIEAQGEYVGEAPLRLKIFGDPDGTFHDFGEPYYEVRALPAATNQFVQTRVFGTGQMFGPQDRVPQRIYFDMNQPPPRYVPYPVYVTPPPAYYDPFYYDRPYFYGPSFRFNIGPRYDHGHGGQRHHR
ncbi:MAG: hypothetical protein ABIR24_09565 [Verrucomicrobiota bacterium]